MCHNGKVKGREGYSRTREVSWIHPTRGDIFYLPAVSTQNAELSDKDRKETGIFLHIEEGKK